MNQVSWGISSGSGFTHASIVGTSTIEMAKSTITPIAAPMPNSRTATTWLVASDNMPRAVVRLAPKMGAIRWLTVAMNESSCDCVRRW